MVTRIDKSEYRALSKYGLHHIKAKNVKLVGQTAPENCGDESMKVEAGKKHASIIDANLR